MYNNSEYQYTNLAAGTTAQIFSGKGKLHAVTVNATASTIFAIYDGVATTVLPVGKLKASVAENTYFFDAALSAGCYVTYAAGDYTVLWSKA